MELYLLRHGIAEDRSASGRDEDRELTSDGRAKLREILRVAARAGVKPSLIVSSPYIRARQTADIAAKELGFDGEISFTTALTPEAAPEEAWSEIRSLRSEPQLLLASHNPLCARLGAYLLGSPELWIDFKKGALLRVDIDLFSARPHGVLQWLLTPRLAN